MTGLTEFRFNTESKFNLDKMVTNKDLENPYWSVPKLETLDVRDYGISKCIESAKQIFTPEILIKWPVLSSEERTEIAQSYGRTVAENFDLKDFKAIVIKDLDLGVLGENCGDGYIYLDSSLINNPLISPLQVVDTITHEMRHQFQSECVEGKHSIPYSNMYGMENRHGRIHRFASICI